jgi:multidrug transporter EmrE-like cation transporter
MSTNTNYITALTAISTVSDFSLKGYALGNNNYGAVVGTAGYIAIAQIMMRASASEGVAYVNNMWNAGTSIVETAVGLYMGEKLSNVQLVGIGLIIVGAYLLRNKQ